MQSMIGLAVHLAEELPLLEADAVLAGDRAAEADAQAQDLRGEHLGAIVRAGLAAVEEDERVQVAVAGVEHVGDADAVLRATAPRWSASASPSRARGTTPSWTMKSGLRRPTAENAHLRPFQIRARSSSSAATRVCAWRRRPRGSAISRVELGGDLRVLALELDDQHGRRVGGVARMHGRFGGVDGEAVHDLHRARQQARTRSIARHGVARGLQARVGGEHGAIAGRPRDAAAA